MLFGAFETRRRKELIAARRLVEVVKALSQGPHGAELADILVLPDYVEDAVDQVAKQEMIEEQKRMAKEDAEARSTACACGVDVKLRSWFAEAAGRTLADGPPPAGCDQPGLEPKIAAGSDLEIAAWFSRFAGFESVNDVDDNGWTPLHHAMQSTVHWVEGHRVCRGLMQMMDVARLGAKTTGGRMVGWTVVHMAANGSDCQLQRANLLQELLQRGVDPEVLDEKGRTPFLVCAGSGAVDTARVLSQAGVNVHAVAADGRNAADRCLQSSGEMKRWL
jgi:hypothetical protein